ncbi:MAG TPA: prephenate dehydrogenase/arogenate dehydrogenase family protein [Verrucomicrobiae bacterium]|nr:prephenate dehydrogenase/arogenate dehydrogenase family protein [Verrucomicrobiae bacterium]
MHWQKITLVGVGLLGGSLGLAIKQRKLAAKVDGYVRRTVSIGEAESLGAVDHATRDLLRAVENADLVILCTPLGQLREVVEKMLPALKVGAIVTDVGSVKGSVVDELEPIVARAGAYFVGSHPMAGGEKTGVSAARADLFANAVCIVTPTLQSNKDAVGQVEELWKALGGRVLKISPSLHDDLVSRSSHLPHVVAAELANYVLSPAHPAEQATVCAAGFRDTTRIASGSPEMWRDIAIANRKNLARVLGVFIEDMQEFCLALEKCDVKAIEEFFEQAKHRRDQWRGSNSPE